MEIIKFLTDYSLKYMDNLKINNQQEIITYLRSRGLYNFDLFQQKMSSFNKAFNEQSTSKSADELVKIESTE